MIRVAVTGCEGLRIGGCIHFLMVARGYPQFEQSPFWTCIEREPEHTISVLCLQIGIWLSATHRSVCTERASCCGACRSLTFPSLFIALATAYEYGTICTLEATYSCWRVLATKGDMVDELFEACARDCPRRRRPRKISPMWARLIRCQEV